MEGEPKLANPEVCGLLVQYMHTDHYMLALNNEIGEFDENRIALPRAYRLDLWLLADHLMMPSF